MMPGEDGLSLCRKLREEAEDLLIIMLSAMGEQTDRIVGLGGWRRRLHTEAV